MPEGATVFVPGVGFRPSRGVRLAEPVTVTKDEGRALRVMSLLSTEKGTELAFELRDPEKEAQCSVAVTDPRWTTGVEVRLRDLSDAAIPEPPPGRVRRLSFGQHAFGTFRRELAFDALPAGSRGVSVELRGELGEWNVPLDLLPIAETAVVPAAAVGLGRDREGITVRIRNVAATDTATYLDVEAVAALSTRSVLGMGAWRARHGDECLVLIDDRGERFEEIFDPNLRRADPGDSAQTVATFPPMPAESTYLTLVVPKVLVQESEWSLDVALPVYAPTEFSFGPYPITVRWAGVVDQAQTAPGEPPARGVEVQLTTRGSNEERRVLRPGRVLVDGARNWDYGLNYADPAVLGLSVRLREGGSAKTITFLDPVVEVRGPWEIQWRR
jgi:hypothetical protein